MSWPSPRFLSRMAAAIGEPPECRALHPARARIRRCNALTLSDLTAKRCPNARCGTDRAGGKSNVHFVPHPEEWRFVLPGRFFSCVGCLLLTALFAAPGYGQDAAGSAWPSCRRRSTTRQQRARAAGDRRHLQRTRRKPVRGEAEELNKIRRTPARGISSDLSRYSSSGRRLVSRIGHIRMSPSAPYSMM